ncbi:asparagine synthase (glutamine-hydrolyzing) [Microbispora sp. SCL1-1]|uniref:asparagine synthase (glutamine-hydrolyzing) n=1 Tax=unclassified Microbispora TaxID=2614687 RepID=UPI001156DB74|nr:MULTISPECIES: asparagine synthase (glutamine-hydrolyzing) [unclassified Microbispora]NJP27945.1 asparagine synthase (glutamine-hydrolyzing) [Microbispora sp. CL1-1]TQS10473.1 asparagine synthase (glutamine-hydrolyzing) [Microbispora sp. SCL1-1]
MCGISGWVDFGRDLRRERETVQAMTDTMACRGPDAEGMWLAPHAAFGHRRLAIIDIEGGRQPMIADAGGEVLAALTYSGEAYNFRELRAELIQRGHRFRTQSDTEVVLEAYLEWGEDFASRLNGMYAFAIWDVRSEELLLVRDRMGIKPLYYYPMPHGVLFGSEPKAILANPLAERVVDADGLREILSFVKTPECAVFRGMYEVRPGQVVKVRREGLSKRRYWRLEGREHTDDLQTTIRTVRELLEDIIERQLISDVPLCTLLSGGLDSSAVTALAARALAGKGAVRSFSVDFAGYSENFQADDMRDTPDTPYVHDVVRHVGSDHTDIVLDSADLMDPAVRAAVLRARDLPLGIGDMDTSLYLLFKAIRKHSTVALSGESADEVFGGYRWFHDPEAVDSGTFPWLAMQGPTGLATLGEFLNEDLLGKLDLPAYRADSYQRALAEVPRVPGETGLQKRMREVSYLHLTRFVQILLDRKDRMSMAVGLEVRVPFCDHRLVEYVFNAPWSMKTFDGHEKSLLRAATADLLPRSVVERRKVPYPSTQDPAYERALRAEVARVLDGDPPIKGLVDAAKVRGILDQPVGAVSLQGARTSLEGILQINAWLEAYNVRLMI